MIALTPMAALVATSPPGLTQEPDAGRTATALLIVAVVLAAAVVTETARYRRRRRVHHPTPLPSRRLPVLAPAPVIVKERKTCDLARRTELVAHHS